MSEFGNLNLDDLSGENARLNAEAGSSNNNAYLEKFINIPDPKPGKTTVFPVRILPPSKGARLFQETRTHRLNGRTYHCPKPLNKDGKWDRNTKCVICDYYNALYREKDKLEQMGRREEAEKLEKEARDIKPIERYYYNAIARKVVSENGEEKNVGPKILSIGKILHKMIVRAIVGDENVPKIGNVTDIKNGYDFIIMKEIRGVGKDGFPNYDRSAFDRAPSPSGTLEEVRQWVESMHNLSELRSVKDSSELEKQLAIHRNLIPDDADATGFNMNDFDSKWNANGPSKKTPSPVSHKHVEIDELDELQESSMEDVPVAPKKPKLESVVIDNDDFLSEFANMEG